MTSRLRGSKRHALDVLILAAFRQARREGERDAAEHLLRALEALAGADEPTSASAFVAAAYLSLADDAQGSVPARSPHRARPKRTH